MKKSYHTFPTELFYTYKILLPKGHKGICANGQGGKFTMASVKNEQELLLNHGTEGTIVNIDYKNHEVTILADED